MRKGHLFDPRNGSNGTYCGKNYGEYDKRNKVWSHHELKRGRITCVSCLREYAKRQETNR